MGERCDFKGIVSTREFGMFIGLCCVPILVVVIWVYTSVKISRTALQKGKKSIL